MIPVLDLGLAHLELRDEIAAASERVLSSGSYILGREVAAFEQEFAEYCEVEHSVSVGNGLDALHLILRALGVGLGHEVIVPGHTFIATWLAVSYTGATPVPVESDPHTFNLDVARIEAACSPSTRAIVAVHLYGQPANMDALHEVAARRGLVVVEDAAQAHGATYKGRRVGGLAHAGAFSFYPAKNLGAFGDGGAITTHDPALAAEVCRLRNYGSSKKYVHDVKGFNSRLDELQAALLRVKLRKLDEWNARRVEVAARYERALSGIPGLILPITPAWAAPVWHMYVVRHSARDALRQQLEEEGIGTLVHYPIPPHRSGAYCADRAYHLPISEALSREVLSLPIGPHLSAEQVDKVTNTMRKLCS